MLPMDPSYLANSATEQPPDMEFPRGGGGDVSREEEDFKPPHELDVEHFHKVNSLIRDENVCELVKIIAQKKEKPVNLMNDPLLSVIIAAKKTGLAVKLINLSPLVDKELRDSNINGDTPLHTAAAEGDIAVAEALLRRSKDLVKLVNSNGETPLRTAALHGNETIFWYLFQLHYGNMEEALLERRGDGSTVLHCAIMGNAPKLALDIARRLPTLIMSRNAMGVTPLQLMVTIPNLFRSLLVLGPFESFLYDWIVLLPKDSQSKNAAADEEAGRSVYLVAPTDDDGDVQACGWKWQSVRSKFPSQYTTILDLLELTGGWLRLGVFKFLKLCSQTVKALAIHRKRHKEAMQLIQHLARYGFYDFYCMGYTGSGCSDSLLSAMVSSADPLSEDDAYLRTLAVAIDELRQMRQTLSKLRNEEKKKEPIRWNEPPLITAAKLGIHDYVRAMLQVCPQSATYLEYNGRNVLQVAIESGQKEVVRVLGDMLQGSNSILPPWLCSAIVKSTRNTILHLAAENSHVDKGDALQLHYEIEWFEMVEQIIPRELVNSRNKEEMTAHAIFKERHKKTLQRCKSRLLVIGRTCAGLLATVVLTSSFSIPGEKDKELGNIAFTIISHAYMFGFGCAATALVLFLPLIISPYKERDFRWIIPLQFFFACYSFALALGAFLLTVVCSIILQIYGDKISTKHLIPLILELVVLPAIFLTVRLNHGPMFGTTLLRRL